MKKLLFSLFFISSFALCVSDPPVKSSDSSSTEQISSEDDMHYVRNSRDLLNEPTAAQLYQWAIKELIESHEYEKKARISHQRQKWIISIVGTLTTIIPLIVAIIEVSSN